MVEVDSQLDVAPVTIKQVLLEEWRFLTFRSMSPAVVAHWRAFLAFGLLFTWLAGVGRYWDNPRAHLWQNLGMGSVAYVLVLALVIWALIAPLKPRNWSYVRVLLFVTLTAPPAVLYAIPVERYMRPESAVLANVWFLVVVAGWRVGLYAAFLRRTAGLSNGAAFVGTLLPLTLIVVALSALNLEHVVFRIMGGLRVDEQSSDDGAYSVVVLLSAISISLTPFVLAAYGALIYRARRVAKQATA